MNDDDDDELRWMHIYNAYNMSRVSTSVALVPSAAFDKVHPFILKLTIDFTIFQQDSAIAHRAGDTIELLRRTNPGFIAPDMWPPNSPDLNLVDCAIWSVIQQRV